MCPLYRRIRRPEAGIDQKAGTFLDLGCRTIDYLAHAQGILNAVSGPSRINVMVDSDLGGF
jgi:hypothetical protein